LAPHGYNPNRIIVGSPSYLEKLSNILEESTVEVLQAYFAWKTVQTYVYEVEDEALKPLRRFNNWLQGKDPDALEERWRTCVRVVDYGLGWILSKFFVEKAFSQDAKEFGDRIVSDIKEQFVEKLDVAHWMSKDVRKLGIQKVHNIVQKIGYPIRSPDIRNASLLENYYATVNISNATFFDNALSIARFDALREWSSLGKPTNRDEWGMTVPTVNAYYNPAGNEIVFPAGIMQSPVFYDPQVPQYLSYGAFGSVSGHELSHAFDSTGRHYDETGNFTEWWDVATVQAFEAKTKCFVDQYHEFTVPGLDGKPLHVNGRLTLGENIADAGGLSASFQAWKKREAQKATQKLPGLQQFSKEQLFFMSYASWWCGKTRKEAAVDGIYRDPHSPKWARILGTMANSREFRESFGCEVKEPTCELW
jgi:endothelin-converting enzyme